MIIRVDNMVHQALIDDSLKNLILQGMSEFIKNLLGGF